MEVSKSKAKFQSKLKSAKSKPSTKTSKKPTDKGKPSDKPSGSVQNHRRRDSVDLSKPEDESLIDKAKHQANRFLDGFKGLFDKDDDGGGIDKGKGLPDKLPASPFPDGEGPGGHGLNPGPRPLPAPAPDGDKPGHGGIKPLPAPVPDGDKLGGGGIKPLPGKRPGAKLPPKDWGALLDQIKKNPGGTYTGERGRGLGNEEAEQPARPVSGPF